MTGNIIFLQQHGEFAATTKVFDMCTTLDIEAVDDVLSEVEMEILASPRKAIVHDESYNALIAYPISALVKRGVKAIINHTHFGNRQEYSDFINAINSRYNDYVVFNKSNLIE